MPNITSKEKRDRLLFIIKVLRQHEVLRNFLKQKDPKTKHPGNLGDYKKNYMYR